VETVFEVMESLTDLDQILEVVYPLPNLDGHRQYPYDIFHVEEVAEPIVEDPTTAAEAVLVRRNSDGSMASAAALESPTHRSMMLSKLKSTKSAKSMKMLGAMKGAKSQRTFRKKDKTAKVFVLK
jgi:hypothetical protein